MRTPGPAPRTAAFAVVLGPCGISETMQPCGAGGFLHAGRLKTLSLLELVYDGFLAPQESSK